MSVAPRILVFGAGAIGQWIGARFASAGAAVTVLCRKAAFEAIRARGLRVRESGGGIIHASGVHAADTLADLPAASFDWIFITVKTFDVAGALDDLERAGQLGPATRVMGFQNGVGTEEIIAPRCPGRSFVCVVTRPIALTAQPGEVEEASARGGIAIAPHDHGGGFGDLEPALSACGLQVSRFDDFRVMKWSKLLLNMTANATCAILDFTPDELYASRRLFQVEQAAFAEALAVMRAMRVQPADLPGYPAAKLSFIMEMLPRNLSQYILRYKVGAARGSKQPSLRLEMERGRPESEVRWLNGAVVEYARRNGLQARANAFLTDRLEAILAGRTPWDTYRRNPGRFSADFNEAMHQKDSFGL